MQNYKVLCITRHSLRGPLGFFNSQEIELHPCGSDEFIKRKDDTVSTVLSRYDIYINTTQPVIDYLSNKIDFHEIDGTLKINEITAKIDGILNV